VDTGDNFGSWLKDLGGNGGLSSRSMPSRGGGRKDKHKKQMDELAQEMKLLNWHKLANEAALKAALISTKKMKNMEKRLPHQVAGSFQSQEEKAQWMQQIIAEEQSKPLEVNADFISNYTIKEQREEERLETEVRRHIESLEALRKNLAEREDLKRRNRDYRDQKEQLAYDKAAGILGKNVSQQTNAQRGRYQQPESETSFSSTLPLNGQHPKSQVSGTLSKVINSLDKLVELEKRISRLEANPSKLSANEGSTVRAQMRFSKKRSIGSRSAPSKTYYSVQVSRNAKASNRQQRFGATSTGVRKPNPRQKNRQKFPKIRTQPPKQPRQNNYMRSQNRATGGGVERRKREPKRSKAEERMLKKAKEAERAERQDKLINKWMQDKKKKASARKRVTPGSRVTKGAASGIRNKNPHMQQFHEIRKQFEKKKAELRMSNSGGAPASGSALKAARQQKRDRTAPARQQSTNTNRSNRLPKLKTSTRPDNGKQPTFPPSFGVGGTGIKGTRQAW